MLLFSFFVALHFMQSVCESNAQNNERYYIYTRLSDILASKIDNLIADFFFAYLPLYISANKTLFFAFLVDYNNIPEMQWNFQNEIKSSERKTRNEPKWNILCIQFHIANIKTYILRMTFEKKVFQRLSFSCFALELEQIQTNKQKTNKIHIKWIMSNEKEQATRRKTKRI